MSSTFKNIANKGIGQNSTYSKLNLSSVDDKLLWISFKKGSESAFITIYKTYFAILYQYGFQFTKDKGLIKDAIQDLFIELRQKRNTLSNTTSIKLYLYKCIKRKILRLKEGAINNMISHQDLDGYNFEINFSVEHLLIVKQLSEEWTKRLNQAIVKLTKRQKEAIYYYFYEDLSYREVMEMMALDNIKSARNLIYKGLSNLKKITQIDLITF